MAAEEQGLGEACTHPNHDAFHTEVLAWVMCFVGQLLDGAPPHVLESNGRLRHAYARLWTGDTFAKALPERFHDCHLAKRHFVEHVLICLDSGIDPASTLTLTDSPAHGSST